MATAKPKAGGARQAAPKKAAKASPVKSTAAKATVKKPASKTAAPNKAAAKTAVKKPAGKTAAPNKAAAGKATAGKAAAKTVVKKPAGKTAAPKKAAAKPTAANTAAPKASAAKKAPARRSKSRLEHMDDRTLGKIIVKLEEMRDESQKIVDNHLHSDMQPREENLDVGDDLDKASNERDREFNLIMHQRHLRRLHQIREAFERINDGTYGLCEGTDEPINPKRLLIMPLARYTLEYQEMQEKTMGRIPMGNGYSESEEAFGADD